MKNIGLLILTVFVIFSCNTNSTKNNKSHVSSSEKTNELITSENKEQLGNTESNSATILSEAFSEAVNCFPADSASLYRFYFKWNATEDQKKIEKQIKRLKKLTSKESIDKYSNIENRLKPLMTTIVNNKIVTNNQADSLVKLYSDYDHFSGESLFSQLLTNEDNYNLVWESFRIMSRESYKDTCFISGLIRLENNISTNAELAEAMGDFVVQSIKNNPTGFLEMYSVRNKEKRPEFANYIAVWEDADKELMEKFTEISEKSADENYRKLATELIGNFKN